MRNQKRKTGGGQKKELSSARRRRRVELARSPRGCKNGMIVGGGTKIKQQKGGHDHRDGFPLAYGGQKKCERLAKNRKETRGKGEGFNLVSRGPPVDWQGRAPRAIGGTGKWAGNKTKKEWSTWVRDTNFQRSKCKKEVQTCPLGAQGTPKIIVVKKKKTGAKKGGRLWGGPDVGCRGPRREKKKKMTETIWGGGLGLETLHWGGNICQSLLQRFQVEETGQTAKRGDSPTKTTWEKAGPGPKGVVLAKQNLGGA